LAWFAILILLLRRSLIAAVLATLLIITCASLLPASVIERVQETRQVEASGAVELDSSTASRFEIWEGARDMLRDHPMGVGLDRFQKQIGNYTNRPGVDAHKHLRVDSGRVWAIRPAGDALADMADVAACALAAPVRWTQA
jgi:O-antigen ligase